MITTSIAHHIRWHCPEQASTCLQVPRMIAVLGSFTNVVCLFFALIMGPRSICRFPKSWRCYPNYLHVILDIFGRLLSPLSHLPFGWCFLVRLTPNDCHSSLCLEFHLLSDLLSLVTDISLSEDRLSGIHPLNMTWQRVAFNTCGNPQHPFLPSFIDSMLWKYFSSEICFLKDSLPDIFQSLLTFQWCWSSLCLLHYISRLR